MSSGATTAVSGPPYMPRVAQLGGLPAPIPDVPITAVLLAFFIGSAATHMTIFQINRRREHKFLFSALLFGFSMARIAATTMRIVWATHQTNVNVAIAASIFTAAGVLILFIVNLIFAQRIVRAYHPNFGWHRAVDIFFRFLLFSVIALLIMVISATVPSFFTLDPSALSKERDIQLFASTYLAVLAFLPIPIVLIAGLVPRKTRVEKFGSGRFRTKIRLLLFTSTLLTFGAWYRAGVALSPPRAITNPAWYHHKAAYYCVNFVIELIVSYTYAIARFDRRFHVPNNSSGPGDYSGVNKESEVFGTGDDTTVTDIEEATANASQSIETSESVEKLRQGDEMA